MKRKYRGILATGATLNEAKSNFKDLVFGKGASVLVDEQGGNAFVAKASAADAMFNPLTGDMDIAARDTLLTSISFVSESSVQDDDTQEAFSAHCTDGCGSHIVASNKALLQFCPLCTASLSSNNGEADGEYGGDGVGGLASETSDDEPEEDSDDPDQLAQLSAEESTSSVVRRRAIRPVRRRLSAVAGEDDGDEVSSDEGTSEDNGSTTSDDSDADTSADRDDVDVSESSEPLVVCASSAEEAVELFRKHKSEDFTSVSGEAVPDSLELELYSCSSAEGCGSVVLSEVHLNICPHCEARLNNPTKSESADYLSATSAAEEDDDGLEGSAASSDDISDDADLPEDDPVDGLGDQTDEGSPQEISESSEDDAGAEGDDTYSDDADDAPEDAAEDEDDDDDDDELESVSAITLPGRRKVSASSEDASSDDSEDGPGKDSSLSITSDDGTPLDSSEDDGEDVQQEDSEIAVMSDKGDSPSDLDVSYSASIGGQPVWTAYVKGKPVAMAHKADCSDENKEMFDTPRFGQAVIATAKITSVSSALDELKFRPLKYSFSASAVIKNAVERGVAKKLESISAEQEEFVDRFKAALATAAIGINRGFFKDDVSPLKEALCSTMRSCGTHAPERLVDRVFSQSHDQFIKQLLARASDILSKPVEVQESLSKAILDVNYQGAATSESSEAGASVSESSELVGGLEHRIGTIGSPVATGVPETKFEVSTSSGATDWQSKSKSVVSGLGRRR